MFLPAVQDRRYAAKAAQPGKSFNLPAPTGGLNARDAYTDMDAHDAVNLVNVFPEANYCVVRKGNASWATGLGSAVRSLMTWNGNTGSEKLFAGAGTKIWDVTAAGAASSVVTGLTNVDFQWTNIENSGGQYLILANGADSVRSYDGTTWATPSITGATSSTFANVAQFKERLWFSVVNSLDLYYLPLQSIAGAASKFPLGAVFHKGGYVIGLGTYSNDSGDGADDYFVIVTSNGEIAVYQGTDPTSATYWSLVGVYTVGAPIGRRCCLRWNGDLAILTVDGIVSMRAALQFSRESIQKATITGKIQTLFSQQAQNYSTNFGWMLCTFPKTRYLIVNVPAIANTTQTQDVMNTVTGAWTTFTNMNAGCWGTANNLLFFGGNDGTVYQADDGNLDNGGNISWELQTAWQINGEQTNKLYTAVRPTLLVGVGVTYAIGIDVDFAVNTPTGYLPALASNAPAATWAWTWPITWGGTAIIDQRWQTAGAYGTWASIHMVGTVNGGSFQVNSFELVAERGGPY